MSFSEAWREALPAKKLLSPMRECYVDFSPHSTQPRCLGRHNMIDFIALDDGDYSGLSPAAIVFPDAVFTPAVI